VRVLGIPPAGLADDHGEWQGLLLSCAARRPEDDSIERFTVRHYRYDPLRRERRHVVVAAFGNEREYRTCMDNVQAEITGRRERGEPVDPSEHASGNVHEPGYLRRSANGHLLSRAIRHGATGSWIGELELPSNMSVILAERPPN
jgi:hypothetical protein